MRFSPLRVSGSVFVFVTFIIAALALTPDSRAAVNAGHSTALRPLTSTPTPCPGTAVYCYEIVNYNASDNNYVTGINNSQQIVGAYSSTGSSPYASFFGAPTISTQNQVTPYTLTSDNDASLSTYLAGLDDGSKTNTFQVGFIVQPLLSETDGVIHFPGNATTSTWGTVRDPHQQSGSCDITEVMDVFDQRVAVGFYETTNGTTCQKHAFEFYSNGNLTSPYTYVNLTPTDPSGSTSDVTSAVANGINILGDVVGNVTWTQSGVSHHGGWIYRHLKYTTFCYAATTLTTSSCTSGSALPTYANGIDFSDVVVGNYTDSSGDQNGYAIYNPWKSGSTFKTIDTNKANTVLWSTNEATGSNQSEFFTGWTTGSGGSAKSSGLVGVCPANHCGSTSGAHPRHGGSHHG